MEIGLILNRIKNQALFDSIKRYKYLPYDMEYSIKVVEAIGKDRNPKFIIDDENRFLYENMIRWVHGDPSFQCLDPNTKKPIPGRIEAGIYIAGNTGSGKSWALEIMAVYCLIDGVQVFAGGVQRCLHWACVRTDTICDEYTSKGTVEKYKKMSILAIQDLAAEPIENIYMGNRLHVLQQILECRGDHSDQITLITSNLPINHDMLIKRYEDRVASRLNEMCNYFELRGKDHRKF